MSTSGSRRTAIEKTSERTTNSLVSFIRSDRRLCVVKAPPGSGKTHTLLHALESAISAGLRVAIAGQTNAQCDDICRRHLERHRSGMIWRFAGRTGRPPDDWPTRSPWIVDTKDLPRGPTVVVATCAKWGAVSIREPFDIIFVDESWQMSWSDFMLLGKVSGRFVLIGDPGQISPTVTIETRRWETSPRAPHRAAPDLILEDPALSAIALTLSLDACRRLPFDSVDMIKPFYDFKFRAWAEPGERWIKPKGKSSNPIDEVIGSLQESSVAIATIPTPSGGPPVDCDVEIAELAARTAVRVLGLRCAAADDDSGRSWILKPSDIGISATHRIMNSTILSALPAKYRDQSTGIRVDTPERWQGLERKLMIVVHPLSGVQHPSAFDLETGRLCVMTSRHRSGLIIVSRDHVPETLDTHIPAAEQPLGRPDIVGRGHHQNTALWQFVKAEGRILAVT